MTGNSTARSGGTGSIVVLVGLLFFAWGFSTVLVDSLIPKLKALFALSYAEVMLTQFCFFIAYFVMSIPASFLLNRLGYGKAIVLGLAIMALGDLGFAPAASLDVFWGFLATLFITASGITLLQVAANPLMASLGDPTKSHSRLTLAQAFNSLGTFVGPYIGAAFILGDNGRAPVDPTTASPQVLAAYRVAEAHVVQLPFLAIAGLLVVLATIFWLMRRASGIPPLDATAPIGISLDLLRRHPRLALGALSIFVYVGAEVTIGSLMTNYLMQPTILGWQAADAGRMVSFYWGGAMVGRFVGSYLLRLVAPGKLLSMAAITAGVLALSASLLVGVPAAVAIIAVGLFNSIMFPTIFTLGLEGLGDETPRGSGILCMAIVGGAVIPPLSGLVADHFGVAAALFVPVLCYGWIAVYGMMSRRLA